MRLNPPLLIIAIVAAALCSLAYVEHDPDCNFQPDGSARELSRGMAAWERIMPASACDVWSDVLPKKPIETIELTRRTEGGATIQARISPDGSGFVAVLPPYPWHHPFREIEVPTQQQYLVAAKTFILPGDDPSVYRDVRQLIEPMRDFQSADWLGLGEEDGDSTLSVAFEIKDIRTRKFACRKLETIMPARPGPIIQFQFVHGPSPIYVTLGANCIDPATRSAKRRVEKAIARLFDATGKRVQIEREGRRQFPYCRDDHRDVQPCIQAIL